MANFFKSNAFLALLILALAITVASCSKDDESPCDPNKPCVVLDDIPYDNLSEYNFFTGNMADWQPNERVLPYDLNTPLFTDYALKQRFIYVPEGETAQYTEGENYLGFPIGSVLIKHFYYDNDFRDPSLGRFIVETRLLIHKADGWLQATYLWNDEQTDAEFTVITHQLTLNWIHYDGTERTVNYVVPNKNDCKGCHNVSKDVIPLGPKSRNMNKSYDFADGSANQLEKMASNGMLSGLPDLSSVPLLPVWDNPTTGDLNDRARAYLDVNCGHCHNPDGPADNSGLSLIYTETDPVALGICKIPIAAGQGSGGFLVSILPGEPDESIMPFRMNSVEADVAMPELGRTLIHDEGLELIREWIASLEGDCD